MKAGSTLCQLSSHWLKDLNTVNRTQQLSSDSVLRCIVQLKQSISLLIKKSFSFWQSMNIDERLLANQKDGSHY